MNNFFNLDGPFFTIMNRAADLIVLNLLYLLCCIPIITIGPATAALYYVTTKIVQGEDAYIAKNFFKAFKQNLVQGIGLWLIVLAFGAFIAVDLYCAFYVNLGINDFLLPVVFIITLLYFMITTYIFPLQSRFTNKIKHTIKNAALLSFYNLPFTIILIAIFVLEVFILIRYFAYVLPLYLMFAIAAVAYGRSFLFMHIFKRYLKEEGTIPEPEDADAWTIPEEYDAPATIESDPSAADTRDDSMNGIDPTLI